MNVLLVITNINGEHEVPYSFSLSSIASYIRSKGYNTKILAIREEKEYDGFIREMKTFNPNVIGFTSVSSQFSYIKKRAIVILQKHKRIFNILRKIKRTFNVKNNIW